MGWGARYMSVEGLTEVEKGYADLEALEQDEAALEAHERAAEFAAANVVDLCNDGRQITRLWTAGP